MPVGRASRGDRICDAVCATFASWTVCCHATVAAGGSLRALLVVFGVGVAALLVLRNRLGSETTAPPRVEGDAEHGPYDWRRLAVAVVGWIGVVLLLRLGDSTALWTWMVCVLVGATLLVFSVGDEGGLPAPLPMSERWLGAIALIAAVWALLLLKPDLDDALYVNFAVAAADSPASPLLAGDTLYGIAGLPIAFPAYRVHSYEIWNGALSYLTGIPAIVCFHWISAAVVAALVPLAYARLFRLLLPGQWLAATALSVLLLAAVGGTHEWNASFAFARIWQGKSVFVAAVLPLVYAYAIEFAVAPSPRRWLMLGASQVAAIGCTSTALWTAPFAAVAALASTVRPTARGVAVLGAGALASGYVLAAAAVLKPAMSATSAASAPAVAEGTLGGVLSGVFGGGALRLFVLGAVVAAWAFSPRGPATRFAVGVPLAALLGPWNPWAERWVAANLTGWPYWRIAWAMPVPILMTLVLAAPLRRNVLSVRGWLACLAVVAVLAAKRPVPVPVRWPALKVPRKAYAWAATLTRRAPPGAHVVAPGEVANWLTTFHGRVYPLDVRSSLYLAAGFIAPEEIRTRRWMIRFASGGDPSAGAVRRFRGGLDRFDVRGVCLRRHRGTPEVETALRDAGFRRTDRDARYEVWTR